MKAEYSLEELAQAVREWCDTFAIQPANGQVGEELTERTIRYYRSLGLLDATPGVRLRAFTGKHRLQVQAIRIYQAQGIPLRRIHEQLYGKGEAELLEFSRRAERQRASSAPMFAAAAGSERWNVVSVADDLLLISRQGRAITPSLVHKLQAVLVESDWPGAVALNTA